MKKSIIIKSLVYGATTVMVITTAICVLAVWKGKSEQETQQIGKKATIDILDWGRGEDEGIYMNYIDTIAEYEQVYKNNYYYLRCEDNNKYTIYMNRHQRVGMFRLDDGMELCGFVKSGGYFFAKYQREGEHAINLARINLKENSIEGWSICTFNNITSVTYPEDYFFNDCVYSVKENLMNDTTEYNITCRDFEGVVVDEYDFTLDSAYKIFKMTKNEILFGEKLKTKGMFYIYNFKKKKGERVTQSILSDNNEPNNNEKEELLLDETRDFSCNDSYIFYVDKNYVAHKYDRKTKENIVLSNKLKVMSINCTNVGIWMRGYDKLCAEDSDELLNSHTDPLYYMDYAGGNMEVQEN